MKDEPEGLRKLRRVVPAAAALAMFLSVMGPVGLPHACGDNSSICTAPRTTTCPQCGERIMIGNEVIRCPRCGERIIIGY